MLRSIATELQRDIAVGTTSAEQTVDPILAVCGAQGIGGPGGGRRSTRGERRAASPNGRGS